MHSFRGFLLKEFYHIFRDRRTAAILFGMPLIQLLLFGFAIRNEIQEVNLGIYDQSHDAVTREITDKLASSGYFVITKELHSTKEIEQAFAEGSIAEAIVFEPGFASRMIREGRANVQVLTDGSNPNISKIITGYTASVLQDYRNTALKTAEVGVEAVPLMMFNPELKSVNLFVPGLMALILMLVSALRPVEIIIGKVVPYFLLSFVNVVALASFVFGVPCRGSVMLLMFESLLFIVTALSLGIFISTITSSQQVAMMISLAGLLLPTILLSGFIFPVASMPLPLRMISNLIPAKWYLIIVRGIMLKGTSFGYI